MRIPSKLLKLNLVCCHVIGLQNSESLINFKATLMRMKSGQGSVTVLQIIISGSCINIRSMSAEEPQQHAHQHIELNVKERDALQRQFQQILIQLAGDQSLVRFKHEYDKLYRALKRSHDNEKILYNKINELSRDLANQTAKLRLAIKLSQEDAQAISFLKQELEKTFKILQLSKEREERAKQKIEALNSKIKIVQSNLEQFQTFSAKKSNALVELKTKKEQLTQEKNELNDKLTKIKGQLSTAYQNLRTVDSEKATITGTLRSLQRDINQIDEKLRKDKDRKEKIDEELGNLSKQRDNAVDESKKYDEQTKKLTAAINQKQEQISAIMEQENSIQTQIEHKQEEIRQLKQSYADKVVLKTELQKQNSRLDNQTEMSKKQYNSAISETSQLEKHNDKIRNQLVHAKEALNLLKKDNEVLMNSLPQIHREIMDRQKLSQQDQQEIEMLDKQRRDIQADLLKMESQFKVYNLKLAAHEKNIEENKNKIAAGNITIENINKEIQNVEKEKDAYGKKAALSYSKYLQSLEQIKLKGNLISEYQKKNIETENKLKEQQKLYESVRSDRNTYSKSLSETEDEIAETKRRYKIVNHQINQLKEQIEAKEVALAKQRFEHKKKDQTLLDHSRELEKKKKDMDENRERIKNFHTEISKLHTIIKNSENERQKKKDEYELVVAERDILGTQLIRRNDQSALLYEKIKIQQTTLAKGETAFRERMNDLKLLNCKKSDLKRELKILMKDGKKIPKFKEQIYHLQSELIEQKLKVKALSEQLENPLNIHRCRSLQGTDPDSYEMSQKIKTLQKRLIFKTEQVVEKEVLVHQKQKQIQEIREIMKRQPGFEVAEKLSGLQRSLNIKTKKMKELAAQINMYQAKTNQFKYDIEKTQKEIQEIKRKYNEQKKREQIAKENEKILQQV